MYPKSTNSDLGKVVKLHIHTFAVTEYYNFLLKFECGRTRCSEYCTARIKIQAESNTLQ